VLNVYNYIDFVSMSGQFIRLPSACCVRLMVPLEVYQYQVLVENCTSSPGDDGCALTLAVRGLGFPGPSTSTVLTRCVSTVTTCQATVELPSTGQWSYLELTSHGQHTTMATLTVLASGWYTFDIYEHKKIIYIPPFSSSIVGFQ